MDLTSVGLAVGAVSSVAGGIWAWWERARRTSAETGADVAASDAERAVADSQQTVYKLITDRLSSVEKEVQGLRSELAEERKHSRKLELHIWKLEGVMRKAGIEPPTVEVG